MRKVTFTKQSISPNIYYANLDGYPRLFATLTKASGDGWVVEIDGFVGAMWERTLVDAKISVRKMGKNLRRN